MTKTEICAEINYVEKDTLVKQSALPIGTVFSALNALETRLYLKTYLGVVDLLDPQMTWASANRSMSVELEWKNVKIVKKVTIIAEIEE